MSASDVTFEEALSELEQIADSLEGEDLTLDEAMRLFERGVARLRSAAELLDVARGRVEELIEDAVGLDTRPFEPGGSEEEGTGGAAGG